jgi:hypothetical protein
MSALHGVDAHFVFGPPPITTGSGSFASSFGHRCCEVVSQERRRHDATAPTSDALGNDSLIGGDVVRGDVLYGNLLLAPA